MNLGKRYLRRGWIFLLLGCALLAICWVTMPVALAWAIVTTPNHGRAVVPDPPEEVWKRAGADAQLRVDVGPPAVTLSVWLYEPLTGTSPRGTVLVLHGVRGSKRPMRGIGRALAEQGYRAVLVDMPGHGASTGDWLTYGAQEAPELQRLVDALERQHLLTGPLGVYGASYGAACGLELAGRDARVRAVVAVASFSSLREVVPCYVERAHLAWLVTPRQVDRALARAGEVAHFDPDDASPISAIGKTAAHVLLIHGTADRNIPFVQAERNRQAGGARAELVAIPGANHLTITNDADGTIARDTKEWFARWLVPAAQ